MCWNRQEFLYKVIIKSKNGFSVNVNQQSGAGLSNGIGMAMAKPFAHR